MLACGGTNADHLLLWIHNSCKDALLIQLKKKKEQSTKMQRFFLTSVQQDILRRSPGSIDCDTLLKALKHKCRYVPFNSVSYHVPPDRPTLSAGAARPSTGSIDDSLSHRPSLLTGEGGARACLPPHVPLI